MFVDDLGDPSNVEPVGVQTLDKVVDFEEDFLSQVVVLTVWLAVGLARA